MMRYEEMTKEELVEVVRRKEIEVIGLRTDILKEKQAYVLLQQEIIDAKDGHISDLKKLRAFALSLSSEN